GPARSREDDSAVPATPVARRLAGELGINLHDCRTTGTRGRVCRLDVEEAARRFGTPLPGEAAPPSSALSPTAPSAPGGAPTGTGTGGGAPAPAAAPEAVPFSPMRRTIGSRLQASYRTTPHFRVRQEIVLDELLALRRSINAAVPGVRISVNDLVVKAAGLALVRVPEVNVQFDEASQSVLRFPHADVAVAVAVPDGLITPIVRSVDTRSLSEVSGDLAGLITRAKAGRLTPDEFQGGTFTVSNLGMFGVTGFDAIINPPQAAILAVGAGLPRPVVDGDGSVVVRTVMEVTLSGDHRVIDGATGASFVGELRAILESPTQMLV
uniref:dihydrolipoamide acetyltransferase family protein n=1 Tax=Actinomyces polynesiensis TaxID=1325934 RepID=UPI0005BD07A3